MSDSSKQKNRKEPRLDLSPSAADRWSTCTASPQYIIDNWDKIPAERDTVFSREGTTAHEVAAAFLENRAPRAEDSYCCPTPIDADMRWHGWNYMEYVLGLRENEEAVVMYERKFPLWYMNHRNAIVDAAVVNDTSLHIIDYKYGAGIVVSPVNNPQATIYAYSIGKDLKLPDYHPVFVHIYQPRGRASEEGAPHVWETTWGEIEAAALSLQHKAELIQHGCLFPEQDIIFKPSDKACQWCPAKGFCDARQQWSTGGVEQFSIIKEEPTTTLAPPSALTVENIAAIVKHGDKFIKWINDVQDYALSHMKAGGALPGFKLVLSRGGNRFWTNPAEVGKLLIENTLLRENEVYEKKLIGVAAVEKLLGKNKLPVEIYNLIGKPPGNPVIAPEDDKREPCMLDAAQEFDSLDASASLDDF